MAKLIYTSLCSLDGYFEDTAGRFDWAEPDGEVHAFINDLDRNIGIYLYGRRMYETMVFWETASTDAEVPEVYRDFAEVWQSAEKIVYSRMLPWPSSARTCIEREFDPESVRYLKRSSKTDIAISGGDLAGQALGAGLLDECHLFVFPVAVGGGKPALPKNTHAQFRLLDEQRFDSGVTHLHYGVLDPSPDLP